MSQTCTETQASVIEINAPQEPASPLSAAIVIYVAFYDLIRRLLNYLSALLISSARLFADRPVHHDGKGSAQKLLETSLRVAARQESCRRRCQPHHNLPRTLLPAPRDKMTVVLDLDETLVCAYSRSKVPADLLYSNATSFEVSYVLGNGRMSDVVVFPRPGVQAFLESLATFAELIVFTAGHAGYAQPVIDMLDPDSRLFAAKLYRPETVRTHMQDYVKDLRRVGRCLSRTVLVDNDPFSGLLQPCNVVPANPFYGDPSDRQLMHNLLPFLRGLSVLSDVRPTLAESFNVPEYLSRHGYCLYEDASGFLTAAATIIS